jgi:hypothetical protein
VALVVERRDGGLPTTVGFLVRWSRVWGELPLTGNGVSDYVSVLVGPGGVAAWSRWWPELEALPASAPAAADCLDAGTALRMAAEEIAEAVKGGLQLRRARPVLATPGPDGGPLVAGWEFVDASGVGVVVDAGTGHLLR